MREREERLRKINLINIQIHDLNKKIQHLEKEIDNIIETDEDYKGYINRYKDAEGFFGRLNYEDYCKYSRMYSESSPEDDYYELLGDMLKIDKKMNVFRGGKKKAGGC